MWVDADWAVLEPLFPPPTHVSLPRKWPLRRNVETILYCCAAACHADAATLLPAGFDGAALVLPVARQ